MRLFVNFGKIIHSLLHQPVKIFMFCGFFLVFSLIFNGSVLKLYGLHRDQMRLQTQIAEIKKQSAEIDTQLRHASDPSFIERQALDKYDLAAENDLVFIFSED